MPALCRLILVSILMLLHPVATYSLTSTEKMLFSPKRITGDDNDMSLRSIIQLPDGRMAFITSNHLHIYNNTSTKSYPLDDSQSSLLGGY
ncbi:hypothetical protein, partial [uncultured Duncaniella sp.]|uniref:hypothetical protein n=1 Tax=uncultured Duncaniella sp. TaxID=2768039 RepID=UPI0025B22932